MSNVDYALRRRLSRADAERRARLDGLNDRAIALWHELAGLAREASEQSVQGSTRP